MLHLQRKNLVHTDIVGSDTFIEWKTTGSQNNFCIIVQKEEDDLDNH
jgi:hypothetical protein